MPEEDHGKIQIGIYRINKDLFVDKTDTEIIASIIESFNKKVGDEKKFERQNLALGFNAGEFKVEIYFAQKTNPPKWRSFLTDVLEESSELLRGVNTDASYIAFVYNDKNIFAISGGHGNFTIQDYVDQNFGIEILTRLISKDSKVVKSLQDRGVTGSILGSTKFFRSDYKLSDEDEFGKIYKQIKAELEPQILRDIFGFTENETKKNSGCLAKASFQINKAINFEALLRIIQKLNGVLEKDKIFALNKVTLISRRVKANRILIEDLEKTLSKKLYQFCSASGDLDFDLCHPNFEEYLTADTYKIFKGVSKEPVIESAETMDDLGAVLISLRDLPILDLTTEDTFARSLDVLNLITYDSEGKRRTWKKLFNHIHGEIEHEGKTYFFIDSEWYEIKVDFIKGLNKDCEYSIGNAINSTILPESFDETKDENTYNLQYLNREGFIVLDKITPDGLEMCDLLKYDDNHVYVVHVKKSFNNSVRELISQILISAKRILAEKKSGGKYFDDTNKAVLEGKTNGSKAYSELIKKQKMPSGGIRSVFENKKDSDITFCLAILDTSTDERDLQKDLKKYKSNIAKFSILELERSLRGLGFGFAIAHVKKQ